MSYTFPHRHLIGINRLSAADITAILDLAKVYAAQNRSAQRNTNKLAGKTVVNLFFETSTRTRTSFDIAAKRLGADVINVPIAQSSVTKGETLLDTVLTIDAMQVDAFVIRHSDDGTPDFLASHVSGSILNAGAGKMSHPTQALLDALTILKHKGTLSGLKVAICGDIEHSRVARSNIHLLQKLGSEVVIVAPPQFVPADLENLGVKVYDAMEEGLRDADAVMMLRIQRERLNSGEFNMSVIDYHKRYGLDYEKLKVAKPGALVLHPGPVNRGVEVDSALVDDPYHSVVLEQVEHGVAVRMACLDLLLSQK
jgi:aspartate carbamoyltransferase catalytic subunit